MKKVGSLTSVSVSFVCEVTLLIKVILVAAFTEEDGRPSVDAKELEATLQIFMLKLRDVESEKAEFEEKLKTEENAEEMVFA